PARCTGVPELDQPLHPVPVRRVGRQQLGETRVVDRCAGERVADVLGDVVVAEADGVGVAERPRTDLGARPDADAADRAQRLVEPLGALSAGSLERGRDARGAQQRRRAAVVDAHAQPLPRGDREQVGRRRRHPQPELLGRPWGGLAEPLHEPAVPAERLLAGDLLLDDPGDERLHDQPGRAEAPAREAPPQPGDGVVPRVEPGEVVLGAEHAWERLQHPRRARAPGACRDDAVGVQRGDRERRRPLGRADAAPHGAVGRDAVGRVARAAPEVGEHETGGAGPARPPPPCRRTAHHRRLRGGGDAGGQSWRPTVEARTTSSVDSVTAAGTSSPSSRPSSSVTACRAIAATGLTIVVSGGLASAAASTLSKPTTATSSGTRRPCSRSTSIAATAMTSEAAKTPSRSGWARSSFSIAAAPPAAVKSPCTTAASDSPAARTSRRQPARRSTPATMSDGPAIVASRVRPVSTRCRTASAAPWALSTSTEGMPGTGVNGRPRNTTGRPLAWAACQNSSRRWWEVMIAPPV